MPGILTRMHPHERIAEHYRRLIRDDALRPGARLPSVRDLAEEYGVATATVRHALSWLRVEGYITTTQRGSFVADTPRVTSTGRDRLDRVWRTGMDLADGERCEVTAAHVVVPPLYVTELFDIEPRDQVVRREMVVSKGPHRIRLQVDWYPKECADLVPELLDPCAPAGRSGEPGPGLLARIERATGRRASSGRDALHARITDQREAHHLGVAIGAPVLAMATEWGDEEGLMVYSEAVVPQLLTIGYQYRL